jgi:hypothetical protein
VEIHQSDRVKLQFRFPQEISRQPMDMQKYRSLDLRRVVDPSWATTWSDERVWKNMQLECMAFGMQSTIIRM